LKFVHHLVLMSSTL